MDPTHPDLLTMEAFQSTLSGLNHQASPYSTHDQDPMASYTNGGLPTNGYTNGDNVNTHHVITNGQAQQPLPQEQQQQNYNHHPSSGSIGQGTFPNNSLAHVGSDSSDGDDANMNTDTLNSEDEAVVPGSINFVFANEKRFADFHSLFRSVPDEERLIEDYGCALQKEILVQGRLFISENHICFNANIFGWVTNLVIAFSEITAIEKRFTAFVIPNAISIITTTNTKGHFFASFLSRDAAHDLLMAAWRKSFPCAANAFVSSNNNMYIRQNRSNQTLNEDDDDTQSFISARAASETTRRNRHRRSSSSASQNWTADEADWDEDDDTETKPNSDSHPRRPLIKKLQSRKNLKDSSLPVKKTGRGRSASELPARQTSLEGAGQDTVGNTVEHAPRSGTESLPTSNTNGSARGDSLASSADGATGKPRSPTTCKCSKDGRHYANTFMTETYPGSVKAMWELLFESDFNRAFLTNEAMRGADVQEEAWKKEGDGTMTKITKYTKWLGMPIGPKTTKAILTDVCEHKDYDGYVTTVTTTSTPDVPSGGSFTTKCRTCISWAGPNQVLVVVTGAVEFTKTSWIKGQIEKGAAEGMGTHYKELNKSIRKHIAAHPAHFSNGHMSPSGTLVASPVSNEQRSVDSLPAKAQESNLSPSPANNESKGDAADAVHKTSNSSMAGKEGGLAGLWSTVQGILTGGAGGGEGLSHLALVSVLILVLLANVYIWVQITNVTTQIEKIQDDILYRRTGEYPMGAGMRTKAKAKARAAAAAKQRYDVASDDIFLYQDQEEAMWAWLTEREAKHRRYQQRRQDDERQERRAYDWSRARRPGDEGVSNDDNNSNDYDNDNHVQQQDNLHRPPPSRHQSRNNLKQLSEAEAQLQKRIDELQQQLEVLERSLESSAS
ncbi:hypothetical protein BGZ94_001077 [Podila epigama]|nr:hypothetical protein BGZ94_001077 [Podila epigama]